ncbi:hypothetical protein BJ508DRAFT_311877 [Ascobolus immersus RN42]|uniref:Uncharacterized protein n=1 Tax=Ascobolus immersus RN42 TaxID=1160509 RepID=A0A3N4HUS5_ASCIM|nr:hypothetical protein BJ508DRAFT_311877 [Ascobolus immersus RN42]
MAQAAESDEFDIRSKEWGVFLRYGLAEDSVASSDSMKAQPGSSRLGRSGVAQRRMAPPPLVRPPVLTPGPEQRSFAGLVHPFHDCISSPTHFISTLKGMVRSHIVGPDNFDPDPTGAIADRDAILKVDRVPELKLQQVHLLLFFKKSQSSREPNPGSNYEAYVLSFIYPYDLHPVEPTPEEVAFYNKEARKRRDTERCTLDSLWSAVKYRHEENVWEWGVPAFLPKPDRVGQVVDKTLWTSHGDVILRPGAGKGRGRDIRAYEG